MLDRLERKGILKLKALNLAANQFGREEARALAAMVVRAALTSVR